MPYIMRGLFGANPLTGEALPEQGDKTLEAIRLRALGSLPLEKHEVTLDLGDYTETLLIL